MEILHWCSEILITMVTIYWNLLIMFVCFFSFRLVGMRQDTVITASLESERGWNRSNENEEVRKIEEKVHHPK